MDDLLAACIEAFGQTPRKFSFWNQFTYMRIPKPSWLAKLPDDKLNITFENMNSLFAQGIVTWGHIIQVNGQMFKPGKFDCPGELVYSLSDPQLVTPATLQAVAKKLGALKGTKPANSSLATIANYLTNEMIRVFGMWVPTSISPSPRCQISTTLFVRKHLPQSRVVRLLLPIVVNPKEPHVAMPLPAKYWPKKLTDIWEKQ